MSIEAQSSFLKSFYLRAGATFGVRKFEREFLSLAGVMLSCRHLVMGHQIEDQPSTHDGGLAWHMLGMLDYAGEMKLLCEETRASALSPVDRSGLGAVVRGTGT